MNFKNLPENEKNEKLVKINKENPTKIPVIFEGSKDLLKNSENNSFKFLVSPMMSLQKISFKIRSRINLKEDQSLYFYCNGKILKPDSNFSSIYEEFKHSDGFLYINFDAIKSFGFKK